MCKKLRLAVKNNLEDEEEKKRIERNQILNTASKN